MFCFPLSEYLTNKSLRKYSFSSRVQSIPSSCKSVQLIFSNGCFWKCSIICMDQRSSYSGIALHKMMDYRSSMMLVLQLWKKKKHRILSDCIISGFLFVGKEILRVMFQFTYVLLFFCAPQLLLVTFTLWLW